MDIKDQHQQESPPSTNGIVPAMGSEGAFLPTVPVLQRCRPNRATQLRDAQQTRGRMLDGILNLLDPLNGQHKPERPGICEAFRRYFSPIASGPLPQGASDPLVIVLIEPP